MRERQQSARGVHASRPLHRRLLRIAAPVLVVAMVWTLWAELRPSEERALRTLVHDRLDDWFPDLMEPVAREHGLLLRLSATAVQAAVPQSDSGSRLSPGPTAGGRSHRNSATGSQPDSVCIQRPRLLLIHGLDEPGIIWDDLAPAAAAAGFEVWELRYPNDQGIDRSAAFLAERWRMLPDDRPVVLIGHSMGGLLAREFVTRWRHPVGVPAKVRGAPVGGVIMVGTPNGGSDWARLRIWLELREHFEDALQRRFSLFAGLRDGLGEAKIDLRPGSEFLQRLNAQAWPESVPRFIIGARLVEPPEGFIAGLDAAAREVGSDALRDTLHTSFGELGTALGDGAVSVESLRLEGAPEPLILAAAHRTMLRRLFADDPLPSAIAPIIERLEEWSPHGALDPACEDQEGAAVYPPLKRLRRRAVSDRDGVWQAAGRHGLQSRGQLAQSG
jgi:pimeloyl-ACP methyl ester carboxylesterase